MRIPEEDLKCVAYVCDIRDTQITPIATAFLVLFREQHPSSLPAQRFFYWVTAGHVINNLAGKVILRINQKTGAPFQWETTKAMWQHQNDSDVAATAFKVSDDVWSKLDVEWIDTALFITNDYKRPDLGDIPPTNVPLNVGLGDETIFLGLFAQHHGKDRNVPIVRFGNIARMPAHEKVQIQIDTAPTYRDILAYLVEARSWGGQSGSPALWTAEFTFKPKKPDVKPDEKTKRRVSALLGVVSSHFDIQQRAQRKSGILDDVTTRLNTGIAIVVPAHAIKDLIVSNLDFAAARQGRTDRS